MKSLLLLFMMSFSSQAFADNHFGLQFGTGNFDSILSGAAFTGATTEAKTRLNGRIYLVSDLKLNIPFAAELGFMAGDQQHTITQSGVSRTFTRPRMTFDLLARLHLPLLSIGAGGFWGFSPWMITEENSATGTHIRTASSAGFGAQDFGLIGSARLTIPFVLFGITVDVRKLWGTHDHANIETGEARSREFQVLAGIELNI